MRILGIDPGLQVCGYACLETSETEERLIEAGVFRTDGDMAIEVRLNRIAEDAKTLLEKFKPDVVAVEELYSHYEKVTYRQRQGIKGTDAKGDSESSVFIKCAGAERCGRRYSDGIMLRERGA